MPVEFLSDEQVDAHGRFAGEPSVTELERFMATRLFSRYTFTTTPPPGLRTLRDPASPADADEMW